jgi:hypothetical protein
LRGSDESKLNQSLFDTVGDEKVLATLWLEHPFDDAVVKKSEKLIVESVDIEKKNGLRVELESVPGEDLEELFEGAKAARKRDESIGLFSDESLAGMHGFCNVQFGEAMVSHFEIDQNLRDDTDHFAVCGEGSLGDGLHEPYFGSAIDEADAVSGESAT